MTETSATTQRGIQDLNLHESKEMNAANKHASLDLDPYPGEPGDGAAW